MRLLFFCFALLPVWVFSATIEVWSGIDHETALKMKQQIEANTDHIIEVRSFDIHLLRAELLVATPKSSIFPDALWVPSDFLGLDFLVNFAEVPNSWLGDEEFEFQALEAVTVHNKIKAIPFEIGNHLLLYARNKTEPVSWEVLTQKAQQEKRPMLTFANPNVYKSVAFYSLFDDKPLANLNFNGNSLVEMLHFLKSLYQQGVVPHQCGIECARQKFIDGEVDYLIDGDWAMAELESKLGDELTILPLPSYKNQKMTSFSGAKVFVMTEKGFNAPGKQAALKAVADWLSSPEFDDLRNDRLHLSPTMDGNKHNPYRSLANYDEFYQGFLESQMMPSNVKMGIVWEALARAERRFNSEMPDAELAEFIEVFIDSHYAKVRSKK